MKDFKRLQYAIIFSMHLISTFINHKVQLSSLSGCSLFEIIFLYNILNGLANSYGNITEHCI